MKNSESTNNNLAIQLINISKRYTVHHEKPTLVEKFVKKARFKKDEEFWSLKDINLTIKKGERVGIIGPNGSGKTTLLKIISGITTPTTGTVKTDGKVVSLIDLEAGFHSELTGLDNIYLNAMLLGMTKGEIDSKLSAIIAFADIKQFIDVPLFTYSSGMKLRLGFAIAVHSNPDILILDEGMSVGDRNFQKKSQLKMFEFFKKGKTMIFAAHLMDFIRNHSDRVMVVKGGKTIADGSITILEQYEKGGY